LVAPSPAGGVPFGQLSVTALASGTLVALPVSLTVLPGTPLVAILQVSLKPSGSYGQTAVLSLMGGFSRQDTVTDFLGALVTPTLRVFDPFVRVTMTGGSTGVTQVPVGAGAAVLVVTLTPDHAYATLTGLTLINTAAPFSDSDVESFIWYRESGGTPGWDALDHSLASATMVNGVAVLSPSGSSLAVLSASSVFYVVVEGSATVGNDQRLAFSLAPTLIRAEEPPDAFGERLPVVTGAAITSGLLTYFDSEDILTFTAESLAPSLVRAGTERLPLLRLTAQVAGTSVVWSHLSLDRVLASTNLSQTLGTVRLYVDRGTAEVSESDLIAQASWVGASATLTFQRTVRGVGGPQAFLVVVDVPPSHENYSFSVSVLTMRVARAADRLAALPLMSSGNVLAFAQPSPTSHLVVQQVIFLGPAAAERGTFVPIAQLRVGTAGGPVLLEHFRPLVKQALSGDVAEVQVYWDVNGNAQKDGHDQLLGAAVLTPGPASVEGSGLAMVSLTTPLLVGATPQAVLLEISLAPWAGPGGAVRLELEPYSFLLLAPSFVGSQNLPARLPALRIEAGAPHTLIATFSPLTLTAPVLQGETVAFARLTLRASEGGTRLTRLVLAQVGGLGGEVGPLEFTLSQPVGTTPVILTLTTKISPLASLSTLRLSLVAIEALAPDTVSFTGERVSAPLTIGDAPDPVRVAAGVTPGRWLPSGGWRSVMRITLSTLADQAVLTALTLMGGGDVEGNDIAGVACFEASGGATLASLPWPFPGGVGVATFTQTLTTTPFVVDVKADVKDTATPLRALAVTLTGVGVLAPDVLHPSSRMGEGGVKRLRDHRAPLTPLVQVAPFSKDRDRLAFRWLTPSPLAGESEEAIAYQYALWVKPPSVTLTDADLPLAVEGTDPARAGLVALKDWTDAGTATEAVVTGLTLEHGATYLPTVRAKSPTGQWSFVGLAAVMIDALPPRMPPTPPEVVKGSKQLLLKWAAADALSGIVEYRVERRLAHKPNWERVVTVPGPQASALSELRVKSYEATPTELSGQHAPAAHLTLNSFNSLTLNSRTFMEPKLAAQYVAGRSAVLPVEASVAGTQYFRVQAVNGAGEVSEFTPPAKVVVNLENLPGVINDVSNYPNPFDSRKETTTLVYVLNQDTQVTVEIFDVVGQLVNSWTYAAGQAGGQAGTNEVVWDGTNGAGQKVASSVYFAVIKASASGASNRVVRKIAVLH